MGLALAECGSDLDGRSEDSEQTQNAAVQAASGGANLEGAGGSQTSVPGFFVTDDVSA